MARFFSCRLGVQLVWIRWACFTMVSARAIILLDSKKKGVDSASGPHLITPCARCKAPLNTCDAAHEHKCNVHCSGKKTKVRRQTRRARLARHDTLCLAAACERPAGLPQLPTPPPNITSKLQALGVAGTPKASSKVVRCALVPPKGLSNRLPTNTSPLTSRTPPMHPMCVSRESGAFVSCTFLHAPRSNPCPAADMS